MGLRCRAGDLAMIIKTPSGESCGQLVDVLDFYGDALGQPNCWYVRVRGSTTTEDGKRYVQPDAWLLPIRPGELEEETEWPTTGSIRLKLVQTY